MFFRLLGCFVLPIIYCSVSLLYIMCHSVVEPRYYQLCQFVKIFRIFCASNFYGFLIFAHWHQGLMSKSQGLVKRKSRLFSTSRRGIFTRSNLFSLIFEHKNRRNSPVMTIPPKFLYKYTTKFFEIQILFFPVLGLLSKFFAFFVRIWWFSK